MKNELDKVGQMILNRMLKSGKAERCIKKIEHDIDKEYAKDIYLALGKVKRGN